jgi:predicted phage tail protein
LAEDWRSRLAEGFNMRAWRVCLLFLPALAFVACGQSSSPTSPTNVRSTPQSSAPLSFGVLVVATTPEQVGESRFARCLSAAGDASCFGASSLESNSVAFIQLPHTTELAIRAVGSTDTAAADPPTDLTSSKFRLSATLARLFLSWRAPVTGPAPTNYFIEGGLSPGSSQFTLFTGNALTTFTTIVAANVPFYIRVRAVTTGGMSAASNETVAELPGVPGQPARLRASVNGSTVTLTWSAPLGDAPVTTYIIWASQTPGGAPTLANFATGNTATTLTATGVAPGTYFVQVRAANSAGIGPVSNEVALVIGVTGPCTGPPTAPSNLVALVNGSTVTLGWNLSDSSNGPVTSYVVEAGSAAGLADLATADTGSAAGTAAFNGVGAGTYYVRVRGKNSCGLSGGSNEISIAVR